MRDAVLLFGCLVTITIFVIIGTLFFIAVKVVFLLIPILFLAYFLFNVITYNKKYRSLQASRFWLTSAEKQYFIELKDRLSAAVAQRDNAYRAAEAEGIRTNKNGRLSARSYRGQDLQGAIDDANYIINDDTPRYRHLCSLPQNRWKQARKHYSKYLAYALALTVWVSFLLIKSDNYTANFSRYISGIGDTAVEGANVVSGIWSPFFSRDSTNSAAGPDKQPDTSTTNDTPLTPADESYSNFTFALVCGTILSLLSYLVVRLLALLIFMIKYRKPPLVSIGNIDSL